VFRAALGQCERDEGGYDLVSGNERATARRQAGSVVARSVIAAVVLTAIVWWI
jgi:hypothetical protein